MDKLYHLDFYETVPSNYEDILFEGINKEAALAKNMKPIRTFGVFIKDTHETVVGGANGITYYGCLYVDMLWISDTLRHHGYGTRLMQESEKIGRERGCCFATVNTMDFEALPFYQKLGYNIEFIRSGYENDSKVYFLKKAL
ncbi:MAG: GNAT family N-acetyltransferase [Chlamydiales bacterium]|nr:GNAT family N-acetyltransferase [Chlamydiales bacterium]